MAKPKPYRKKKESKPSNLASFKDNAGGGQVEGVIVGPDTSIGQTEGPCISHPTAAQGSK